MLRSSHSRRGKDWGVFIKTGRDDERTARRTESWGSFVRGAKHLPSLSVQFSSLSLLTRGRCQMRNPRSLCYVNPKPLVCPSQKNSLSQYQTSAWTSSWTCPGFMIFPQYSTSSDCTMAPVYYSLFLLLLLCIDKVLPCNDNHLIPPPPPTTTKTLLSYFSAPCGQIWACEDTFW